MNDALSIAMIGQRGVPARGGGVERAVEELGARLADRGHRVTVYCRSGYTDDRLRTYRGMALRRLPAPRSKHLEALVHSGISTVDALLRGHDVVHFHALGPGIFSPLCAVSRRSASVQTIQGLDDERAKWSPAAARLLRLARTVSACVPNATIVVSEELQRVYAVRHQRHTTVIPNGMTALPPARGTGVLERLGIEPGRFVLFVGRLVPEKRPELLIEAFTKLPGSMRLVLAGGTSHTDEYVRALQQQAAADPRIVLPGYVFGDELAELYGTAAVYCLPSDLEGLPLSLLEAIGAGCPVVASDIEPHREVLGTTSSGARLFARGDAQELESALRDVLEDPGAGQGVGALRERTLLRYDWEAITEATLAVYRSAISRSGS